MTLREQLSAEMKSAMRVKDKQRLSTIRLIRADIKRIEVDTREVLNDAQVLAILDKMVKRRRDSIGHYETAERDDLAAIEKAEIAVIQDFLPTELEAHEIHELISLAIQHAGATTMRDMGAVMALLKPQIQGRANIGNVSTWVKSALNE